MKRLMLIGLVFLFSTVIYAQNALKTDGAEIKFSNTEYDYGKIVQGSDGTCTFKFKNIGNEVLVISDVRKSCGCTTPVWSKEPVLPGQSGEIKVGYNTNIVGPFSKNITVISNAVNPTVVLTIKGEVVAK